MRQPRLTTQTRPPPPRCRMEEEGAVSFCSSTQRLRVLVRGGRRRVRQARQPPRSNDPSAYSCSHCCRRVQLMLNLSAVVYTRLVRGAGLGVRAVEVPLLRFSAMLMLILLAVPAMTRGEAGGVRAPLHLPW